jgi:hypothetical protein
MRHGWNPEDLLLEQGEFDLVGFGPDGRVVLAMEAKARVAGPDSLEKLLRSFRTLGADPAATVAPNSARKWRELVRYCRQGPVVLWLVAAGARSAFDARWDGAGVTLRDRDGVEAASVRLSGVTGDRAVPAGDLPPGAGL